MVRLVLAFMLLTAFMCPPARADAPVTTHLAEHGTYSRLVFQWPSTTTYTITQETGGSLLVSFAQPGTLDTTGLHGDNNVTAVAAASAAGQNLSVRISSPPGGKFRGFSVGNRVIVDVYGPTGAAPVAASTAAPVTIAPAVTPPPKAKPPAKQAAAKKAEPVKTKPVEKKVAATTIVPAPTPTPATIPAPKMPLAQKLPPVAAPSVAAAMPSRAETHTISLTTTETTGIAAFVRNGNLWLVSDHMNIAVPPSVEGPHAGQFTFRRVELNGALAFITKLPADPDLEIYGEGSGLIWHVVLTPKARDVKPTPMQRNFPRDQTVAGVSAFWPMPGATKIVDAKDPDVGDTIKIVTVNSANQFSGPRADTVDFTALRSAIGLALEPKVDDLTVSSDETGVHVTRPQGLTLSPQKDISLRQMREDITDAKLPPVVTPAPVAKTPAALSPIAASPYDKATPPAIAAHRIFDFDKWQMGGLPALDQNTHILMSGLNVKDRDGQVQDLLTMAKMSIANDRGPEAIGFLEYALDQLPALEDAPEYKALRGAAEALAGQYELALEDLNFPALKPYGEIDYWRAYTLSWLEDWQQAHAATPVDLSILFSYPPTLREKIGLKLAEAALHAGDVKQAQDILGNLEKNRTTASLSIASGMDYLEGEAHRQKGELDAAKDLWTPLSTGKDHLYRAKAGLALTTMQLQKGDIKRDQAIDRLEGLRYVWRGDELEARINFLLGKLYLESHQYLKGFGILKDASTISPDADIGHEITSYMADAYKDLLMKDKDIAPLDAAMVYEQYPELIPGGDDADKMAERLAERLVEADLLTRASALLQHEVSDRLHGAEQAQVAVRLAAIYLLDHNPQKALAALDVAQAFYEKQTDPTAKLNLRHVQLMHARALSEMNKTQDALALLAKFPPDPDVNSLRADIAWQAGLWEQAASALNDMIVDQALDPARPLAQKQADLILNRAVALNLSGNHVALANLRTRFQPAMNKTSRAKLFDVVSAPRESPLLSDRQTLANIVSEVDIFKDFLDSYRATEPATQ